MKPLSFILLCIAATVGSFALGRWQNQTPAVTPAAAAPTTSSLSPLDSLAATWPARWRETGAARRDLLLQSWIARDPRAAFRFIVKLPPGSIAGQDELMKQALLAWGRREPAAAYTFACTLMSGLADALIDDAFARDENAALEMLRCRVDRPGTQGGPNPWVLRDPARACASLAALPSSLKQTTLMNSAFKAWAEKDPAAAVAFALTINKTHSRVAIAGIMEGLPQAEAVALTLKLKNPEQVKAAVWRLMMDWGRKDPAAATAWAIENLTPAALASAMGCFAGNVVATEDAFKNRSLAEVLSAFTPAAWLAVFEYVNSGNAHLYLRGAPEWFRPRLYEILPGNTTELTNWTDAEKAPPWFQKLPADQVADVIQYMAKRESGKGALPALSSIPPQWRDAAAHGLLEYLTGPRGAADEKVQALPEAEKALLRAQLPNMDQSLPTLPRILALLRE